MRFPCADIPATAADMQALRDDLALWRFRAESAAEIMLGFIGQACLGGAMTWHAHVVVSGNTGAGKTLLYDLVAAALGGLALRTNDFTAAALRQMLTTEARVLMLDEAESDPKRGRVRQVIELLRAMSSGAGARAIRGSAEGIASSYTLAGSAYLSAIVPPGLKPQDQGRITHIELLPIEAGAEDAQARAAVERAATLSPALWARMIQGWPRFKQSLAVWRAVLMAHGCGPRQADQPAHLLAAYWTLVDDDVISEQIARNELPRYEWMITTASDAAQNDGASRCWNHLLGMVDPIRGGEHRTIGQLIREARGPESHDARKLLQSYGIKLDPPKGYERTRGAWVSNDSPMLKRLFASTEWEDGGWPYELRRLSDSYAWKHPVRIGESKSRATFVAEQHLPGSADNAEPTPDDAQASP
jgi:hypothetical protein